MSAKIKQDVQSLDPGAIVELFVLDATAIGGAVDRFHAGTNGLGGSVVWQGQTYSPWPIEARGFDRGGGKLPRPTISIANVLGTIGALAAASGDLLGAKLTRKRTFVRYLDAANFPGNHNPTADPDAHFADDEFYVDRKARETKAVVEFELAARLDLDGVRVPLRVCARTCTWEYRGEGCGYAGGPVARADGTPTADPALDACGKRLSSCRLRFGSGTVLPYGGFPAVGLYR